MRKWRGLAPLERSVESQCDQLMVKMGWTPVRFLSQRGAKRVRRTSFTAGIPDRKYYRGHDSFWFECKAEDGRQSDEQKAFQEMCESAGELYVIGGVKELVKFLRSWGEEVKTA